MFNILILQNLRKTSFILFLLIICVCSTLLLCVILDSVEFPQLKEPKPYFYISSEQDFPLLNLPHFKYLINNDVCRGDLSLNGVIIITSHIGDIQARQARRNAFPFSELQRLKLRRVFLLAKANKNQKGSGYKYVNQELIIEENKKYGDIIQGDFIEAYRNLSYKHVMGLNWAVQYCNKVKYIIKLDDDIAVNIKQFLKILESYGDLKNSMAGYVLGGMKPDRENSKWKVSLKEWSQAHYPNFLSGWLYATSPNSARKLLDVLAKTKYFWIDDVLVSGIARQRAGVDLVDLSSHYALHAESLQCCLQGYTCNFVVAPCSGDWDLLKRFMQLSSRGHLQQNHKPMDHCVITPNPNALPLSPGWGRSQPITLK